MLSDPVALREIERLAAKYIWWKPVSEAINIPELVAAQVMNLGDYHDICKLSNAVAKTSSGM
jgi:hypothetical protein